MTIRITRCFCSRHRQFIEDFLQEGFSCHLFGFGLVSQRHAMAEQVEADALQERSQETGQLS